MEYVLNTDIFDLSLPEKLESVILNDTHRFEANKVYKLIVSFHADHIKDLNSFDAFTLPALNDINNRRKKDEKDKIYDVLVFQLEQLEKILLKINIEFYSSTIQGDQLESAYTIKVEVVEDDSESVTTSKGKKQRRWKVRSIVPSMLSTKNLVAKLASEQLSELYNKVFNVIRNKKIMSEILGINETDNDNLLFQAFVKEYGGLWLTTTERKNELLDKLSTKTIEVLEKYELE